MKNLNFVLLIALQSTLTIGCSENLRFEDTRWSRMISAPVDNSNLDSQNLKLKIGKKDIQFVQQFIQGVEVEDSFEKKVYDNEIKFFSAHWIKDVPIAIRLRILLMKLQSNLVETRIQKRYANIDMKRIYEKPKLIIQDGEVRWKLVVTRPNGELEGIFLDSKLNTKKTIILGSRFATAEATLFPEGPLKSKLQNIVLHELAQNRTLDTKAIKVSTQSAEKAYSENFQFNYSVEDQRFAQVQVFYYLTKTIGWAESELQFRLPYQLEAETFVGFPEKTNTAFYYQRKIRLGEGDGVIFSNIPLDPTLVIHETFHALIDAVARLPFQGEGGSINEGFADFLTAMTLKNPNLGEVAYKKGPFKRTIENSLRLQDQNGGLYHDSGIVSGLLWNLSQKLGYETGLKIGWEILIRLNPTTNLNDFSIELNEILKQLPSGQQEVARKILDQRGWTH